MSISTCVSVCIYSTAAMKTETFTHMMFAALDIMMIVPNLCFQGYVWLNKTLHEYSAALLN